MRVIVTRPERDAHAWVEALAQHGFDGLALPLISIRPVPDTGGIRKAWEHLSDYAALMFVSGSAVEHFFAQRLPCGLAFGAAAAAQTRAWATGPGTAAALLRCGVDIACIDAPVAHGGQFDSEALWAVVAGRVGVGDRVLIVRGTGIGPAQTAPGASGAPAPGVGRDWLAERLVEAGVQVEFVLAYERGAPVFSPGQVANAQHAASDGSVWLFTSAQAVANLSACLPQQNWAGARALATHARIANAARAAGFGVVWESRPSISDVVASIESNA